jgi:hypothetical protein
MLPRVKHDLFDSTLAQSHRRRRRLDELRPVSDYRKNLHSVMSGGMPA